MEIKASWKRSGRGFLGYFFGKRWGSESAAAATTAKKDRATSFPEVNVVEIRKRGRFLPALEPRRRRRRGPIGAPSSCSDGGGSRSEFLPFRVLFYIIPSCLFDTCAISLCSNDEK